MKYFNALNTIYGLGGKKMKVLANTFGTSEKIWQASFRELAATGIGEKICRKIVDQRPGIDPELEWNKLQKEHILILSEKDADYPPLLRQIPDNPYLIYMKGDLACLKRPLVAVVGSRKLTAYGMQAARGLAHDLAKRGICVVSGLAFGIDACAHNGALVAKGKTIAVLGNSLDDASIAPRSNFNLAEDILANGGLLISEFPVPTSANTFTFPARNRIMAGMSLGTLVIEAAEKSGSLITANLALDYNREVFAVPGSIFSPQSTGTHKLIKAGAKLVCCADDIIVELKLAPTAPQEKKTFDFELSKDETTIYNILSHESIHIDIITKLTKLDTSTIASTLVMLEIKGAIKDVGGQNYIKL